MVLVGAQDDDNHTHKKINKTVKFTELHNVKHLFY